MFKTSAVLCVLVLAGCAGGGSSMPSGNTAAQASAPLPSMALRHAARRFSTPLSPSDITDIATTTTLQRTHPRPTPTPSPSPSGGPTPSPSGRTLPSPLLGTTVDDISDTSGVVASLARLQHPITRVVFDRQESADYYSSAMKQFDAVGYTMGELLDSSDIGAVSVASVLSRTNQYLATLGSSVDLWEIGNEVNGEWLGSNVPAKIHEMYGAVKAAGGKTEMTLYYEPPQTVTPGYDMIPWEQNTANVPADMHAGLDYVLVSYYETDNNGIRPTQAQWNTIFAQLAADFPNAKVGFGEVGIDNPVTSSTQSQAADIMQYYYGLKFPAISRFVGGDFWWYFAEDCVPTSKPLLTELQSFG